MIPNKPMLAKDAALDKLAYPVAAQIKLDGIRALIAGGVAYSRTLKPIPNAEIQAFFADGRYDGLDGELIVGPPEAEDAYRRTTSFVMAPNKTGEPWAFHAFDFHNRPGVPYALRRSALVLFFDRIGPWESDPVFVVPQRILHSEADLDRYESEALAAGHEGVILRDLAAPYKHGRATSKGPLLKVKRFIDFEATILGTYEEQHNGNEATMNALGRTQRSSHAAGKVGKDRLGGLVLRALNGPCAGIEFRCGTGFTADQRRDLWAECDALVGRTVTIKSFPIGVKQAPRHPVWKDFRNMELDS